MKCQCWNEFDDCCEISALIPDDCDGCHYGWLPFWSLAERAGLKAMGISLRTFRPMSEYPTLETSLRSHKGIIRAYVQAARKVKEGT